MNRSFLLLLLLPLPALAQYRPMYTPAPSRPMYTPAPVRPGPSPMQQSQQSQQQAHQNFQRMQTQQSQQAMQNQMRNQQQTQQNLQRQQQFQQQLMLRRPQQLAQQQQQQQQREAEQQATEYLAHFAEEQRNLRLKNPAPDAEQALAQQSADARQLTVASVKAYREVFLPGQLTTAQQALMLPVKARQDLQNINQDLLSNSWWNQKEATQVPGKIAAYGTVVALLTTELLGFDLASSPAAPAPISASGLYQMLAKDTFDPLMANQLMQGAARDEKIEAGDQLAHAAREFSALTSKLAASPEQPKNPRELRDEVKASLQRFNKEMQRYQARVGTAGRIYQAQQAILTSTAGYLAKPGK